MKTWKQRYFWWCEAITIIVCAILFLSLGKWAGTEESQERWAKEMNKPVEMRLTVEYVRPVDASKVEGKAREAGTLSPEMEKKLAEAEKTEHWRMIRALREGKTNQNILDGPPGLGATWSRKARIGQYRLEQQRLLEEQELGEK